MLNQWAVDNLELLTLINSVVMIILTGVYVSFTIKIQKANKSIVDQNETIRKEQNMPNVIVHFDMLILNMLDLRMKNIGKTPALDIKVKLTPLNEIVNVKYLDKSSILQGVAFLAPDQSLKTLVGVQMDIKNKDDDYPVYTVDIAYKDLKGESYSNQYIIDANMYKGNVQVRDNTIHDLTKEVEKLRKVFEKK